MEVRLYILVITKQLRDTTQYHKIFLQMRSRYSIGNVSD